MLRWKEITRGFSGEKEGKGKKEVEVEEVSEEEEQEGGTRKVKAERRSEEE